MSIDSLSFGFDIGHCMEHDDRIHLNEEIDDNHLAFEIWAD